MYGLAHLLLHFFFFFDFVRFFSTWQRPSLTSCLASLRVLPSNSDITNRNVHIAAGSYVNCSVIAFDTDERKSERGQIAFAMRIHTYIVGPISNVPYTLNLFSMQNQIQNVHQIDAQ